MDIKPVIQAGYEIKPSKEASQERTQNFERRKREKKVKELDLDSDNQKPKTDRTGAILLKSCQVIDTEKVIELMAHIPKRKTLQGIREFRLVKNHTSKKNRSND